MHGEPVIAPEKQPLRDNRAVVESILCISPLQSTKPEPMHM
mgnify:CR=1 FL=1